MQFSDTSDSHDEFGQRVLSDEPESNPVQKSGVDLENEVLDTLTRLPKSLWSKVIIESYIDKYIPDEMYHQIMEKLNGSYARDNSRIYQF